MMLKDEERISLVKIYGGKANERLQEARQFIPLSAGFSTRASYEAAYYSTVAILISYGLELPKTHEGINVTLKNNFVDGEKIFPNQVYSYLGELEKDRNTDQYSVLEKISEEQAGLNLKKAEAFLETAQDIVKNRLDYLETRAEGIPTQPDTEDYVLSLGLLSNPQIYSTPSNLVNYRGPILHVDLEQGFSVQQTGNDTLLIHKHEALRRIPEKGENLQINYRPGSKAEIKELHNRNKNMKEPEQTIDPLEEKKALIAEAKRKLAGDCAFPVITDAMEGRMYSGEIIAAGTAYVVQKVDEGRGIIHNLSHLKDFAPSLNSSNTQPVTITYDQGMNGSVGARDGGCHGQKAGVRR
jgi:uncharacterized protein (UPF0332 family)